MPFSWTNIHAWERKENVDQWQKEEGIKAVLGVELTKVYLSPLYCVRILSWINRKMREGGAEWAEKFFKK